MRTYEQHGLSKNEEPLYNVWKGMKKRCYNKKELCYSYYGGRGITVCPEWRHSYLAFRAWAYANGYRKGLILDREENDGNYEPDNCRFITVRASNNNTSKNVKLTAFGETKTIAQWTEDKRCRVKAPTLYYRFHIGWNPERALTQVSRQVN